MIKSFLLASICFINLFPFSAVQAETSNPKSLLITEGTYNKLSTREQKKYIKEVRKNYYEFEAVLSKEANFADSSYDKYKFVLSFLIDEAFADANSPVICVIGGVELDLSQDQTCPIRENLCKNEPDKFQCSEIYANVCVNVSPKSEISKRCYEESINSPVEYSLLKPKFDEVYKEVCLDLDNLKRLKQEHVAACHYLGAKLDILNGPLERELRENLTMCESRLASVVSENERLLADLEKCQDKLPTPEVTLPQENMECSLLDSQVNGSNLKIIGNIQMFKKDSRMVHLLGNTQNVNSINITNVDGKACFSFQVTDRAAKRFKENRRLKKNTEFAQMDGDKIQGCTSNGVETIDGKLYVPALLSREYNFATMSRDDNGKCKVGTDLLKKINGCFKGSKRKECEKPGVR